MVPAIHPVRMRFVERRLETHRYYSIKVTDDCQRKVIVHIPSNNGSQTKAILSGMKKRLSLIQGPPG